ncbi:unnamed protein product [Paramecium sonneborni]|uniref:Uncharacterized protein n=1 Tax=Paramecium sonneborni TaxID=65129 RepID=A0A8S1R973_9CILI|nr:unnamed protein product [Paramecium sonneborni]
MIKSKTNKSGRPPKMPQLEEIEDDNYIATNKFALQMMEIFSSYANYKLLTITGPSGKKNNEQMNERRKNVEKNQRKLRENLKIQEDYTFFLRDLDKSNVQYELKNDELVEKNQFQLNYEEFSTLNIRNDILRSIELVSNQLNTTLQQFLIEFVKQFIQLQNDQEKFKVEFFDYIINNPDQFQELINWSQLYDEAFEEKRDFLKLEVELFKEKFTLRGQDQFKKYKVDEKREAQLKLEQGHIQKLEKYVGEHRSLKLFIEELTETFDKFCK